MCQLCSGAVLMNVTSEHSLARKLLCQWQCQHERPPGPRFQGIQHFSGEHHVTSASPGSFQCNRSRRARPISQLWLNPGRCLGLKILISDKSSVAKFLQDPKTSFLKQTEDAFTTITFYSLHAQSRAGWAQNHKRAKTGAQLFAAS